eukprot:g1369.t1
MVEASNDVLGVSLSWQRKPDATNTSTAPIGYTPCTTINGAPPYESCPVIFTVLVSVKNTANLSPSNNVYNLGALNLKLKTCVNTQYCETTKQPNSEITDFSGMELSEDNSKLGYKTFRKQIEYSYTSRGESVYRDFTTACLATANHACADTKRRYGDCKAPCTFRARVEVPVNAMSAVLNANTAAFNVDATVTNLNVNTGSPAPFTIPHTVLAGAQKEVYIAAVDPVPHWDAAVNVYQGGSVQLQFTPSDGNFKNGDTWEKIDLSNSSTSVTDATSQVGSPSVSCSDTTEEGGAKKSTQITITTFQKTTQGNVATPFEDVTVVKTVTTVTNLYEGCSDCSCTVNSSSSASISQQVILRGSLTNTSETGTANRRGVKYMDEFVAKETTCSSLTGVTACEAKSGCTFDGPLQTCMVNPNKPSGSSYTGHSTLEWPNLAGSAQGLYRVSLQGLDVDGAMGTTTFVIELKNDTNNCSQAVFNNDFPSEPLARTVGCAISETVAMNPSSGQTIILSKGPHMGASAVLQGTGDSSRFKWTPGTGDVGAHVFCFQGYANNCTIPGPQKCSLYHIIKTNTGSGVTAKNNTLALKLANIGSFNVCEAGNVQYFDNLPSFGNTNKIKIERCDNNSSPTNCVLIQGSEGQGTRTNVPMGSQLSGANVSHCFTSGLCAPLQWTPPESLIASDEVSVRLKLKISNLRADHCQSGELYSGSFLVNLQESPITILSPGGGGSCVASSNGWHRGCSWNKITLASQRATTAKIMLCDANRENCVHLASMDGGTLKNTSNNNALNVQGTETIPIVQGTNVIEVSLPATVATGTKTLRVKAACSKSVYSISPFDYGSYQTAGNTVDVLKIETPSADTKLYKCEPFDITWSSTIASLKSGRFTVSVTNGTNKTSQGPASGLTKTWTIPGSVAESTVSISVDPESENDTCIPPPTITRSLRKIPQDYGEDQRAYWVSVTADPDGSTQKWQTCQHISLTMQNTHAPEISNVPNWSTDEPKVHLCEGSVTDYKNNPTKCVELTKTSAGYVTAPRLKNGASSQSFKMIVSSSRGDECVDPIIKDITIEEVGGASLNGGLQWQTVPSTFKNCMQAEVTWTSTLHQLSHISNEVKIELVGMAGAADENTVFQRFVENSTATEASIAIDFSKPGIDAGKQYRLKLSHTSAPAECVQAAYKTVTLEAYASSELSITSPAEGASMYVCRDTIVKWDKNTFTGAVDVYMCDASKTSTCTIDNNEAVRSNIAGTETSITALLSGPKKIFLKGHQIPGSCLSPKSRSITVKPLTVTVTKPVVAQGKTTAATYYPACAYDVEYTALVDQFGPVKATYCKTASDTSQDCLPNTTRNFCGEGSDADENCQSVATKNKFLPFKIPKTLGAGTYKIMISAYIDSFAQPGCVTPGTVLVTVAPPQYLEVDRGSIGGKENEVVCLDRENSIATSRFCPELSLEQLRNGTKCAAVYDASNMYMIIAAASGLGLLLTGLALYAAKKMGLLDTKIQRLVQKQGRMSDSEGGVELMVPEGAIGGRRQFKDLEEEDLAAKESRLMEAVKSLKFQLQRAQMNQKSKPKKARRKKKDDKRGFGATQARNSILGD